MHQDHMSGLFEVICGPMFSGKTEELIRRLRRAQIARQRVLVFKPQIDDRFAQNEVVSHSQLRILSVSVSDCTRMVSYLEHINFAVDVIGIDEVQFFDLEISSLIESLVARGIRVVAAGLDQDYMGRPFGPIADLLARADSVSKQSAVCVVCGHAATKTQRIAQTKSLQQSAETIVLVGATEHYEARCRACHVAHVDAPKSEIRHPLVNEVMV